MILTDCAQAHVVNTRRDRESVKNLNMKQLAFGICVLLLPSFAGQATAEQAELLSDTFRENLRPAANTGGARVMGLQVIGADPAAELQAIVPQSWAGEAFCVRTSSSDGLYDSENTYRAPVDTSEPVVVPHVTETRFPDKLTQADPEGFGIRILRAPCEDVTDTTAGALALWRTSGPVEAFTLFVNSFDADRLVAFPEGGDPVECTTISADITVAFDRVCAVPELPAMGTMTVRLIPVKDGRRGRPETLVIDLR